MNTTVTVTDRARTVARSLLDDLADPGRVRFLDGKPALRKRPASVGGGAAGVALAHIEAARTGHGPWETAHRWLARSLSDPVDGTAGATAWSGAPALGLVTAIASTAPSARTRLDEATCRLTLDRLSCAHARLDTGAWPELGEFDLIQGLSGLASYHLHTRPGAALTRRVLDYLVRLSLPLPGRPDLPGWWSGQSPNARMEATWPGGHLNLGMAHGIGAPLAVLSLAVLRGVAVSGQAEAIERMCAVLDTHRSGSPSGAWWPYYLTPSRWESAPSTGGPGGQRPSWCYGTPGLARAQQLAGLALDDPARRAAAEQAMADCLDDNAQLDTLTESGLCHGWAGLVHCAWRINTDVPGTPLAESLERAVTTLLDRLDRERPPDPEFLDGRAGIALALHTYANGTGPGVPWDAFLTLA